MRSIIILLTLTSSLLFTIKISLVGSTFICTKNRNWYETKGFGRSNNRHHIYSTSQPGSHSKICRLEETCCTLQAEINLKQYSRNETARMFHQYMNDYRTNFISKYAQVDDAFNNLHKLTIEKTDYYLTEIYDQIYSNNKGVFHELMNSILKYYQNTESSSLEKIIEDFLNNVFAVAYQIKFIGNGYKINMRSKETENCFIKMRKEKKPFKEDTEKKLEQMIKHFLIPTKAFAQGLRAGRDFISNVMKQSFSKECAESLTRLQHCQYCTDGLNDLSAQKPCYKFCTTVMNGCFAIHHSLQSYWVEYTKQLRKLTKRLKNQRSSWNGLVENLRLQMSNLFMDFQDGQIDFNDLKAKLCVGLDFLRQKRSFNAEKTYQGTDDIYLSDEPMPAGGTNRKYNYDTELDRRKENLFKNLDNFFDEIEEYIPKTQNMFGFILSETICHDLTNEKQIDNCWNGHIFASYNAPPNGDLHSSANPEVKINMNDVKSTEEKLVNDLQAITKAMEYAIDNKPYTYKISKVSMIHDLTVGSGIGSGYRNSNDDIDEYDDDDDDDYSSSFGSSFDKTKKKKKKNRNKNNKINYDGNWNFYPDRKDEYEVLKKTKDFENDIRKPMFYDSSFQNDQNSSAISFHISISLVCLYYFITFSLLLT